VFRFWLLLLVACVACTDGPVRSGTVAEPADFLPTSRSEGDTLRNREQARLVLRCEEGRVGAYIIVGTVAEVESGRLDDRAVPVQLDSTPRC
jgi:hypothetical protein